ncbi:hypothetical protein H0H87_003365 [Tephrocybe sp. NHM501043]|nr:hypothetical protein H0H87_003365 [Tephrocybe sp. NHM501043]
MICNKRLDSYTLLEHNEKPYCKSCHVKNFGTRDLRQANLPYREAPPDSDLSASPLRNPLLSTPPRLASPLRSYSSNGTPNDTAPRRTALSTSPISSSFPSDTILKEDISEAPESIFSENTDNAPTTPPRRSPEPTPSLVGTPSNTGRPGLGGIPRTVPLTPTRSGTYGSYSSPPGGRHSPDNSIGGTPLQTLGEDTSNTVPAITPILQTTTGTRYGVALTSNLTGSNGSPRRWGASTNPSCPRCGKSVYFAEQVSTSTSIESLFK